MPGYFFYQTKTGFKFKSIDKLIDAGKKNKEKVTYNEVRYKQSSKLSEAADFTILQYNVTQNNDLITKLALGQFSSQFMEFDPLYGTFTTPIYARYVRFYVQAWTGHISMRAGIVVLGYNNYTVSDCTR